MEPRQIIEYSIDYMYRGVGYNTETRCGYITKFVAIKPIFSNSTKGHFRGFYFLRPISRNWIGNDFYNTKFENSGFFYVFEV